MPKVCRVISFNEFELYSLRKETLVYERALSKEEVLRIRGIKYVLLSPSITFWETASMPNKKFKPNAEMFLFNHASITKINEIVYTAAVFDKNYSKWWQAWILKSVYSEIKTILGESAEYVFEVLAVQPECDICIWKSGHLLIKSEKNTREIKSSPSDLSEVRKTLNEFKFSSISKIREKKKENIQLRKHIFLNMCLIIIVLLVNTVIHKEIILNRFKPAATVFNNAILAEVILKEIIEEIPSGQIIQIKFSDKANRAELFFKDLNQVRSFIEVTSAKKKFDVYINKKENILSIGYRKGTEHAKNN